MLNGGVEDFFYCEMYVDDIVNAETCARKGEEGLLAAFFSAISDHIRMLGNAEQNPVPILSQRKSRVR